MSQILSLRVPDTMVERLERFARRQGNGMTRTKASVLLLEEALREAEFAHIEYRDTPIGRQPFLKGTGLAVWEMSMIAHSYAFDVEQIAQKYPYPAAVIQAALNFYEAYPEEMDQAIEDNNIGYEALKRLLPNVKLFTGPGEAAAEEFRS
jgi:uncharacterized protein (DUF433 family)